MKSPFSSKTDRIRAFRFFRFHRQFAASNAHPLFAEVKRLVRQRIEAAEILDALSARRATLLAAGAAGDEISNIDADIIRLRRRLERTLRAEPALRAEAEAAEARSLRAEFASLWRERQRQLRPCAIRVPRPARRRRLTSPD